MSQHAKHRSSIFYITLFVLFLNTLLIGEVALAGPLGYKEGRWILKAKESYFSTQSNFDKTGVTRELPVSQSLSVLTTSLSATYDIKSSISIFSILDTVYAKSVGYDFQRTRFTPTDLKLGGDFLLLSTIVDVVPEVMITAPLVGIDTSTDETIPSEGVFEIRAGSYISQHFSWLSAYGYLGYATRTDGRSSILPYEIQIIKSFGSIQGNVGLWGHESISDDEKTNSPADRNIITSRVNGGSLKFYSVNPSVTEIGGSIGFDIGGDMFGRLGYSHTLFGANTAYGDSFWASLSYTFGSATPSYYETKKYIESNDEKRRREFKPETYEEEPIFDEAIQIIKKEEPNLQPPSTLTDPNSKAPVSVKLRAAKPEKKKKKKPKK